MTGRLRVASLRLPPRLQAHSILIHRSTRAPSEPEDGPRARRDFQSTSAGFSAGSSSRLCRRRSCPKTFEPIGRVRKRPSACPRQHRRGSLRPVFEWAGWPKRSSPQPPMNPARLKRRRFGTVGNDAGSPKRLESGLGKHEPSFSLPQPLPAGDATARLCPFTPAGAPPGRSRQARRRRGR